MVDLSAFKDGIVFPIRGDISGLKTALGGAESELSKFESKASASLQAVGKKMTSAGKNLSMKVTTPLTLMGTASVMTAVDFDDSMQKIRAVTGATGDQFDALRDQAMELGRSTKFSASEAAEGMTFLGMAGFDTTEIMAAMPDMLNLAAAGALDLGTAADIASNILTGFGLEAGEAGRVADVMAKAAANSNTDMTQLGEAMKYVAPVAAGVGMSMEQATAIIGKFSDAGIQGSMAGTSLRQAITSLLTPSDEAAGILDNLGVVTKDAEGNMVPFNEILGQLESSGMSTAEAMEVFGARAGPAMVSLISGGSEALEDFTGVLEDSGGAAQDMADTMESGPGGAFRTLKSATEDVMIQFGDLITEALLPLISIAKDLMTWFSGLDDSTKKMILVVAGLAAVLGPLLIIFGMITTAIGSIITILPVLGAAFALLSANPIILAIGGLILLFVLLQTKFDIVGKAAGILGGAFEWLSDTVSGLIDWITNAVDWSDVLGTAFKILLGPIGWVMLAMDHFGISWDDVWNGMFDIADKISSALGNIWGGITDVADNTKDTLVDIWSWTPVGMVITHWDEISEGLSSAWTGIVDGAEGFRDSLRNTISGGIDKIMDITEPFVSQLPEEYQSMWGDIWTGAKKFISGDYTGAFESLKSIAGTYTGLVFKTFDDMRAKIIKVFDNLKSSVLRIWQGIERGIKNVINHVIDAVNTMIRGLNRLSFDVPDWVPGDLGGKHFGFDINTLPHLAAGGVVTEPTVAMVGEAGPEAIVPLSGSNAGIGGVNITVENMNVRNDQDVKKIATELYTIIDRKNGARGIR